ncbi:MAG: VWA domain-containing protein [Brucellaceae bacterium]|nr:VWA domain-containing protein [Brucellaceae bacterium]
MRLRLPSPPTCPAPCALVENSGLCRALESFTSDVFSVKSANLDVAMAVVPFNGSVLLPAYAANWRLGSREGREGTRESSASRQETGAAVAACATTRNGVWDMTNRTPAEQRFDRVDANTPICPDQELRALTSNRADLINFARGLQEKSGGTANHIAASWAYRILSPKWADFWPAGSASQKTAVKIALLMTDGENAKYGGLLDPDADDLMLEACQNMKADGIEIYAIAFQTPLSVRPLLEQCASSADHVYSAGSNAQLESAFEAIAQEALSKRMIKLVN